MPVQEAKTDQEVNAWIHAHTQGDVLVYLGSEECAGCKVLSPIVDGAPDAYPHLLVLKTDVADVPQTVANYGVRSLPTLLLFRDQELVGTRMGANKQSPWRDLVDFIDSSL